MNNSRSLISLIGEVYEAILQFPSAPPITPDRSPEPRLGQARFQLLRTADRLLTKLISCLSLLPGSSVCSASS